MSIGILTPRTRGTRSRPSRLEYLLIQSDIGKFNRARHPLEWLAQPATSWGGNYFIPFEKTAKEWSHQTSVVLVCIK